MQQDMRLHGANVGKKNYGRNPARVFGRSVSFLRLGKYTTPLYESLHQKSKIKADGDKGAIPRRPHSRFGCCLENCK